MYKITTEKILYQNRIVIKEAQILHEQHHYSRIQVQKENASAVLVLNTDSNKFILTKQFRYPIATQHPEPLLEILAGKIDEGEMRAQGSGNAGVSLFVAFFFKSETPLSVSESSSAG